MHTAKTLLLTIVMVAACGTAFGVVEAAYTGPYGNPEEPALRPYKWFHHGGKSLVFHVFDRLKHGNLKTPVIGTVEVGRGVRRGVFALGESLYKGSVFAPPPGANAYRELGAVNTAVEEDWRTLNFSDFAFTWAAFPVMKVCVDHYPLVPEEKVQEHLERAREIREERREAFLQRRERAKERLSQRPALEETPPLDEKGPSAQPTDSAPVEDRQLRGNLLRLAK